MLVVPDANIMYSDLFFEADSIRTILDTEDDVGLKLAVPEVIVDELRNHVRERANKAIDAVNKSHSQIDSLVGHNRYTDGCVTSHQKQDILDRFEERVKQFREEGRILHYPSISPKELADRSIRSQLPFLQSGESDRGMRDTLIWLTLKEHLKRMGGGTPSKILFVTNDKEAFFRTTDGGEVKLHQDLMLELESEGFPQDSVTIRRNLNDVITEFISPPRNIE